MAAAQTPLKYESALTLTLPPDIGAIAAGGSTELAFVAYYNLTGPDCAQSFSVPKQGQIDLAAASNTTHVTTTIRPAHVGTTESSCTFEFEGTLVVSGNPDSPISTPAEIAVNAKATGGCFPHPCDIAPAEKRLIVVAHLVVPPTNETSSLATQAWYRAPLAPENLPNTLQVGGAVAAAATFLVGLLLVRRRRSLARKLLGEVEALTRKHAGEPAALRHALVQLDTHAQSLVARGRLAEDQYGLVARRIDSAMRHP